MPKTTMFLLEDEDGASMVEYALLLALIAVVCVASLKLLGESNRYFYDVLNDFLD